MSVARTSIRKLVLILSLCTISFVAVVSVGAKKDAYPFGDHDSYVTSATEFAGWNDFLERSKDQEAEVQQCVQSKESCQRHLRSLRVILQSAASLEPMQQVKLVNRYVNRFGKHRYKKDKQISIPTEKGNFRIRHDWVTLSEFLKRGGDCEDYATTKYQILRILGMPAEDLRIVIAYDRFEREYHGLVAVRLENNESFLLDTDNRIYARQPTRYRYIFSLNEDAIWDHDIKSIRVPRSLANRFKQ